MDTSSSQIVGVFAIFTRNKLKQLVCLFADREDAIKFLSAHPKGYMMEPWAVCDFNEGLGIPVDRMVSNKES